MDAPGVIVVGGPPGAGKTTLGWALASRFRYGSTTVDDLAVVARSFTSPASHPALHVMARGGHTAYFTEGPVERLIADAEDLSRTMWPALERVILSHLRTKGPVVLDWWLFSPGLVASLGAEVGSVWLWIEPDVLAARERELSSDFVAGSRDPERMMANFMARSLWRNGLVRAEAEDLGLPILTQHGTKDVDALVDEAVALLRRD